MNDKDKLELYRAIIKKIYDANKEDVNTLFFTLLEYGTNLIMSTLMASPLSLEDKKQIIDLMLFDMKKHLEKRSPDVDRMKYTLEVLSKLHESDTSNSPGNCDGSDSSL